jgi:acetoin utilization protein AcuB
MFRIFLEMFGARESGVRVSLLVPEGKGVLAKITTQVADIGGNIVSLGTLLGDDPSNRDITLRVNDVSEEALVTALEGLGLDIRILDVRFCPLPTCE